MLEPVFSALLFSFFFFSCFLRIFSVYHWPLRVHGRGSWGGLCCREPLTSKYMYVAVIDIAKNWLVIGNIVVQKTKLPHGLVPINAFSGTFSAGGSAQWMDGQNYPLDHMYKLRFPPEREAILVLFNCSSPNWLCTPQQVSVER